MEAPMVMMISVTGDAPRAGAMANRYSAMPNKTATTTASSAASGRGMPAAAPNDCHHTAEHDEFALGKVDDLGCVED